MNHTTMLVSKEDVKALEKGETVLLANYGNEKVFISMETDNDRIDRLEDELLDEHCQAMIDEAKGIKEPERIKACFKCDKIVGEKQRQCVCGATLIDNM